MFGVGSDVKVTVKATGLQTPQPQAHDVLRGDGVVRQRGAKACPHATVRTCRPPTLPRPRGRALAAIVTMVRTQGPVVIRGFLTDDDAVVAAVVAVAVAVFIVVADVVVKTRRWQRRFTRTTGGVGVQCGVVWVSHANNGFFFEAARVPCVCLPGGVFLMHSWHMMVSSHVGTVG